MQASVPYLKNWWLQLFKNDTPLTNYYDVPVASHDSAESFASFFENKVTQIVNSTRVNPNVHNGNRKMHAEDSDFMTSNKLLTRTDCDPL